MSFDVCLVEKAGGKSGRWQRGDDASLEAGEGVEGGG
jgi:hypothetical protein